MTWMEEMIGWLSSKFVHDDVGPELDRLSAVLRGGALEERLGAIKQLTYVQSADAVSLLIGALKDQSPGVRRAAVSALGYKGSADGVAPLAVLLGDADSEVRVAAVQALNDLGGRSRSWFRFWRGPSATAPLGAERSADLVGRALADPELRVRSAALASLPRQGAGGVEAVRAFLEADQSEDRPRHLAAAEPELVRALEAKEPRHRRAAVETLFRIYGERAIRPLAAALRDASPEVRAAAVDAVTSLGPRPALGELLQRLRDSDEKVVVKVIEGLVCARNLKAFGADDEALIHDKLLQIAKHHEPDAQRTAVWALGEIGRVSAVGTLCQLLDDSRDQALLSGACEALGKINDPRAVGPLVALCDRGAAPTVMVAAVRALCRADDVRAIPTFVRLVFREARPEVEAAVEEALAALCRHVEEQARDALESADPAIRLAAIRRAISEPRLVFALMAQMLDAPDQALRDAARDTLGKQGHDLAALARATLVLEDKTAARRILAINLMVALRTDDAETRLEALLRDQNEPAEVYRHAVSALKRIGSEAALAALRSHASHPQESVRDMVHQALA